MLIALLIRRTYTASQHCTLPFLSTHLPAYLNHPTMLPSASLSSRRLTPLHAPSSHPLRHLNPIPHLPSTCMLLPCNPTSTPHLPRSTRCFVAAPDRPTGPPANPSSHPPPHPPTATPTPSASHAHSHTSTRTSSTSSTSSTTQAHTSGASSSLEAAALPADSSADALRLDKLRLERAASSRAPGRIEIIVGPMFAGKSTELLKRARAAADEKQRVAYVKSSRDTRYAAREVVTHTGEREACFALERLMELEGAAGEVAFAAFEVIAIDEAQFFPDLVEFCCHAADVHSKTLYVAGLDGDFRRQRFGDVLELVPLADAVHKLASSCSECGQPAPFTVRTTGDESQELVGGSDMYRPVCRHHYALFTAGKQGGH